MLASQLCVFDDKTDLRMKMSKNTYSMVVLSELSSFFVKISICDALSWHNLFNGCMQSECVMPYLTQGIRTIKTFIK